MTTRAVGVRANDKKAGMTLSEVSAFVFDALQVGLPGDTKVEVSIGFRSQIQEIRASGVPESG